MEILNFIKKAILDMRSKPDYKDVIRQVFWEYGVESTESIHTGSLAFSQKGLRN